MDSCALFITYLICCDSHPRSAALWRTTVTAARGRALTSSACIPCVGYKSNATIAISHQMAHRRPTPSHFIIIVAGVVVECLHHNFTLTFNFLFSKLRTSAAETFVVIFLCAWHCALLGCLSCCGVERKKKNFI